MGRGILFALLAARSDLDGGVWEMATLLHELSTVDPDTFESLLIVPGARRCLLS